MSKQCPICGSNGDDLIFNFYCSNHNCKNFRDKKKDFVEFGGVSIAPLFEDKKETKKNYEKIVKLIVLIMQEVLLNQTFLVDEMIRQEFVNYDEIINFYPDPFEMDEEELRENCETYCVDYFDEDNDGRYDMLDELSVCIEPQEIYEWWAVTGFMAAKLEDIGEPILVTDYGTWWGRTCTGQSIELDGTIQKIASKL